MFDSGLKDATYFNGRNNRMKDNQDFRYTNGFSKRYVKKSLGLFLILALGHELVNAIISYSTGNSGGNNNRGPRK
jgi:hypothetical protein